MKMLFGMLSRGQVTLSLSFPAVKWEEKVPLFPITTHLLRKFKTQVPFHIKTEREMSIKHYISRHISEAQGGQQVNLISIWKIRKAELGARGNLSAKMGSSSRRSLGGWPRCLLAFSPSALRGGSPTGRASVSAPLPGVASRAASFTSSASAELAPREQGRQQQQPEPGGRPPVSELAPGATGGAVPAVTGESPAKEEEAELRLQSRDQPGGRRTDSRLLDAQRLSGRRFHLRFRFRLFP